MSASDHKCDCIQWHAAEPSLAAQLSNTIALVMKQIEPLTVVKRLEYAVRWLQYS